MHSVNQVEAQAIWNSAKQRQMCIAYLHKSMMTKLIRAVAHHVQPRPRLDRSHAKKRQTIIKLAFFAFLLLGNIEVNATKQRHRFQTHPMIERLLS